jgi:acetyltransferase-like isoleucine patch superfamily enzyme
MKNKRFDLAHYFELSFSVFPILQGLLVCYFLYQLLHEFSITALILFVSAVYILPLATFRLLTLIFPIREGAYHIGSYGVQGWVLALKIQMFLSFFSVFEKILQLIPGLFSVWLRCWGSSIGSNVIWTPDSKIFDRSLLQIGNNVLIGNMTVLSSHIIKYKNNSLFLYCRKIKIGNDTLVGGRTTICPGVVVGNRCQINGFTTVYPNVTVLDDTVFSNYKKNDTTTELISIKQKHGATICISE